MQIEKKMTDYYAKRASEYEHIYHKPERQENLQELQKILSKAFSGLDLLEIACGTGYWTHFASHSAKSIIATDYNEEVLTIAKQKNYEKCPITFLKADAYTLDNINESFSGALVAFWWSHVTKAKLADFLQILHSKLSEDATVIILDNRYVEGSSTPINRTDNKGNTYQIRKLSDGSIHEVLKNFPSKDEFNNQIKSFTSDYTFEELDYFWLAQYKLKK
jgi:SAM-dependent methyltransferase